MAKDKVGSLGTEVFQSKKNVTKKMQKTIYPPELSPLYSLAEGEKLLPHSVRPDWFGGKYRYSRSSVTKRWIDRVDRVEEYKGEVWKSADIYDYIQLPKNYVLMHENLMYAALFYWSISTYSFHFRFGMMGPIVLDIVALTGLRPHGKEVSAMLGMAGSTINFSMCRGRNCCDRERTDIFSVYVAQRALVL
ncbi:hypothetical protein KY284_035849 [Solanum tuberosum]|nr:hypothetical protein KY284_035849 [Solanum tuberosum]